MHVFKSAAWGNLSTLFDQVMARSNAETAIVRKIVAALVLDHYDEEASLGAIRLKCELSQC